MTSNMHLPEQRETGRNEPPLAEQQAADLLCLHDSPVVRAMYLGAGFVALFLAVLGAILPVLPTTPFVLLAAACFARGSEHFHRKLLENQIAGPIIREWTLYRSIPQRVKRWVYFLMTLSFGSSILIVPELWQKIMLVVIGSILAFYIWRIPVRKV
ncbi:YbaN family protein [Nitrosomonas sp. Is24]|uniref:YbaN family protein n=1 Tax=Nitrosomonas sp. Is24 TaxID=3080533 RepID=UPI00294AE316|nr:YbaN family protein [Nitrosomonas sp. Is24]MDV6342885.1 YbaN family protein [Nitrosomonas sp. Is24]